MVKALFSKNKSLSLIAGMLFFFVTDISARAISQALEGELATTRFEEPRVSSRPSGVQVRTPGGDEYVQSEAQLQLDDVQEKMAKLSMRVPEDRNAPERPLTPNQMVTPYLNIFAEAINREVQFKNSHYVFYHAGDISWSVLRDLYKKLYIYYKKPASSLDDFVFLRFTNAKSIKAQDFLQGNIQKFGGVNDNIQSVREVLLSTNIAFFGNAGFPGEFTWNYFLEPKSHRWPLAINYNDVLSTFNLTYDLELLTNEGRALAEMLTNSSPDQVLMQLFIPQNIADNVAYLSWVLGFPAHQKSMELIEERLKGKPRVGKFTGEAVKAVMEKFKRDKDNPIYKELVKAAADGEFGISGFMKVFRNNPFSLENANETQARVLLTKEVLEPNFGTKIFTYVTTPKKVQDAYLLKIDQLAKKIIDQENRKTPAQKAADKAKNEALMASKK